MSESQTYTLKQGVEDEGIEADVGLDRDNVYPVTPYVGIDLETELWVCRKCGEELGDARDKMKQGLLVNERDPDEVHRSLIGEEYKYTYAPDGDWCRLLEYYCPSCATQVEVEYLPPGHPPVNNIRPDVDWLIEHHLEEEK